ncbi:HAMP domain-containing protein, partial [Thiolapillus sp.]|uniref:HAMP domain-containing protein n=1 Tax=Thiolapillus sp. TaxID=2017437 RepID=UPI00273841A2
MGAGSLIVVINLLGGWWFIRRFILKPVAALNAASDELASLGNSFNQMAESLQRHTLELEESHAFLQALVDAIPD